MAIIGRDIYQAKTLLDKNKIVSIPTETVYGLAGNALEEKAVIQIFQIKNRPTFDPLIVHTDSLEKAKKFVKDIPPQATLLAKHFWPGPLTLLLPKQPIIPDLVTAGLDIVAIRIPNHPLTLALLKILDYPLAAPSANPFGYISPTTAEHVQTQLGNKIDYILDGGACKIGIESTIIGFEDQSTIVYRLGGIKVEDIEQVIGKVTVKAYSTSNPKAPGMLLSHYAPRKPLYVGDIEQILKQYSSMEVGVLAFKHYIPQILEENHIILSKKGDFAEAAQNLFAAMRKLDEMDVKVIWAELLPNEDLGRAINDRIRRAAHNK